MIGALSASKRAAATESVASWFECEHTRQALAANVGRFLNAIITDPVVLEGYESDLRAVV